MAKNPLRPLGRLIQRLARRLTRRRVTSGGGDFGFGPPGAGVREPRRPDPTLPGLSVALPDPKDPART